MCSIGFNGLRIQGKSLVIIVVKVGIVGLGKQIAGVAHCQIQQEEKVPDRAALIRDRVLFIGSQMRSKHTC